VCAFVETGCLFFPVQPYGHDKCATLDIEFRHARFPHPNPPPEGEGTNESLRDLHVKGGRQQAAYEAAPPGYLTHRRQAVMVNDLRALSTGR